MSDIILPSKLVPERITVRFNFLDELLWAETIASASTVIKVVSGIDQSPSDMLIGPPAIVGTFIHQKVQYGVPGVIYNIIATAVGSTGKIYNRVAYLAILPVHAVTPPLIAEFFTSHPYPVEVIEGVRSGGNLLSGREYKEFVDNIRSTSTLMGAELLVILVDADIAPEGINSTSVIVSADLFSAIKFISIKPEGINSTSIIVSAALDRILIEYTNAKPEGITSASNIISGSLA